MKHVFLGWVILHGLMLPATYWPRQRVSAEVTMQRCTYLDRGHAVTTTFVYYGWRR